jgi:pimeloyl-ACP methyl ester carboxylesterase
MNASAEHMVHTGAVELCVQSFGDPDDPPILLIAGGASSMLHWAEEFCDRLAAGRRFVIRYYHRDTGRSVSSPPGAPQYTGRDLAEDVIGVLDAFAVARAHVVGISMGGGIGQSLAIHHPDRVASLTLSSASPVGAGADDPDLPPASEDVMAELGAVSEPDWSDRSARDGVPRQPRTVVHVEEPAGGGGVHPRACKTDRRPRRQHRLDEQSFPARNRRRPCPAPARGDHRTDPGHTRHRGPGFPHRPRRRPRRRYPRRAVLELEQTGHELPPAVWDTVIPAIIEHSRE